MSLANAIKLFTKFHARKPRKSELVQIVEEDVICFTIGHLDELRYIPLDEKTPYVHKFNPKDRPALFVSSDGSQLYILGGGYRFTKRGIEG